MQTITSLSYALVGLSQYTVPVSIFDLQHGARTNIDRSRDVNAEHLYRPPIPRTSFTTVAEPQ